MKKISGSWWEKIGIFLVLFLLIRGWFFGSFIDEQENIAGGWLISQGLVIYRDFFLHHTPLPYFISSVFFLGGQPPWWLWRLLSYSFVAGAGKLLWQKADRSLRPSLLLTGALLAIATPKLNLNMYLADTFFAVSFSASLFLVYSYWRFKTPAFAGTVKWLLFFLFVSGWSTIVAVPPFLLLLIILLLKEFQLHRSWKDIWFQLKKLVEWFLFSSAVFPVYFFLSGAWSDFWRSAIVYNQQYYFPVRLAETAAELQGGPFYYAFSRLAAMLMIQGQGILQIFFTFLLTLKGIILNIGSVSLTELLRLVSVWLFTPVTMLAADISTVLALGIWSVFLALLWQKKWLKLFLLIVFSGLLFMRNNETFHLSVLFLVVFWLASFLWLKAIQSKRHGQFLLLGFFLFITVLHFSQSYQEHIRNRFPIVTQEQQKITSLIGEHSRAGERIQVIGGGLTYYQLSNRLPAGRTIIYYSWFQSAPEIRQPLLNVIVNQQASLIFFEEHTALKNGTYFDPELAEILETYYSEAEQGIYLPRKLNEAQY